MDSLIEIKRRKSVHIFWPSLDVHVAPVSSPINTMKYSIAPTAVTDTVVLVYGLSIMSRSAPVYFGPRKGEMPGLPFYWVCLPQPWVAQVWQICLAEVNTAADTVSDVYAHPLPPWILYHSFFASLVVRGIGTVSALGLRDCAARSVCRCSCLISVGGLRLVRRSEFVDFIDSGVHRFCFTSPCWIIDWIANAYD